MRNFFTKISDLLRTFDDLGGTIFFSALTGLTTLYWKLDSENYPNAGWLLKIIPEKWIIIILGVSIIIIFILALNKKIKEKSYKKLTSELTEANLQLDQVSENIYNMFDGVMLSLSQKFGFEKSTKARLSLYVNDDDKSRFVPCGRYSPDPVLRKKGRSSFSHGQGCIWKCWQNDFHFDNNMPAGRVAFRRHQLKEYDIPEETCEILQMKPRLIAGKRIDDALDNELGVIIIEAKNPDTFTEDHIRRVFESSVEDLSRLILTLKDYIPIPSDAEEAGL